MVKKTAKGAKTASQRAREEQWRRRAAAQGGLPAPTGTVERDDSGTDGDGTEATYAPRSSAARSTASTYAARSGAARSRTSSSMGAASQRRQFQAARPGRMRLAANTLSIDEEMHYVRSDIRRLIILTAICLVVLIALSFVLK
jgi:hypothetical protein